MIQPKMSLPGAPNEKPRSRAGFRRSSAVWFWAGWLISFLWFTLEIRAHQVSAVVAEAKFFRDGTFRFGLSLDVQASSDPALNDAISPEQAALNYLRAGITFLFDEKVIQPEFSQPATVSGPASAPGMQPGTRLYSEASGGIPPGSQAFYTRLSPDTEVALVLLVERDGVKERRARTLFAGETSRPVDLTFLTLPRQERDPFDSEGHLEPRSQAAAPEGGAGMMRRGGIWLFQNGARGLVLLVALLLAGISAQAVGLQSVTFLGALFAGQLLFNLGAGPPKESLGTLVSALLLAGVAAHNWRAPQTLSGWRYALAFAAGMVQGVCFPGKMLPGFLLGQAGAVLGVSLLLWLILGAYWKSPWYISRVLRPACLLLLVVAIFWLWQWRAG